MKALLPTADVMIDATGSTLLSPSHFDLLPDICVLMSLFSSDRELSASALHHLVPRTTLANTTVRCVRRRQQGPDSQPQTLVSGFSLTFNDHCRSAGKAPVLATFPVMTIGHSGRRRQAGNDQELGN